MIPDPDSSSFPEAETPECFDPASCSLGRAWESERRTLLALLKESIDFLHLVETVGDSHGRESLLEALANALGRILPWRALSVHARDAEGRGELVFGRGILPFHADDLRRHREDGLVEWVLASRKAALVSPEASGGELPWILVPMSVLGRATGWISLQPAAESRDASPQRLEMARLVAAQAAASLDNLRQLDRLRRGNAELESLHRLASRVGSSLDLPEILEAARAALHERFAPKVSRLWVFEGPDQTDRLRATLPVDLEASSIGALARRACRERGALRALRSLAPDAELDELGVDVLLAIPVVHRGDGALGVLVLGDREEGLLDEPEALPWLTGLANLLAAAFENANLYAGVLESHRRMSELQSRLVQAARLAGIGELAGGVAHEINNPLQVILGRIQILQMRAGPESPLLAEYARVEAETRRIATTVRGLLEFARQESAGSPLERVRLGPLTDSVLQILSHRLRRARVEVEREGFADSPAVEADPDQFRQVVLNLCLNALQAMPDGGRLRIAITEVDGWARLSVGDTGPGVAPPDIDHLFDPFFTTRPDGSGLGLSLCYSIVQRHGGRIALVSSPGEGAVFQVELRALPRGVTPPG